MYHRPKMAPLPLTSLSTPALWAHVLIVPLLFSLVMMKQAANIPLVCELGIDKLSFDDFSLDVDAMITAALRMFIELGMVQKFKIDYEVSSPAFWVSFLLNTCSDLPRVPLCVLVTTADPVWSSLSAPSSPADPLQMAADCQEELQAGSLPQLEARVQRLPVHVCYANGKHPVSFKAERHLWVNCL